MDLHRIENNLPDWENNPDEINIYQKVALKTRGVVTPGNLVTTAGLGLVAYGSTKLGANLFEGIGYVTAGRLADVADGMAANKTGTKSPLGEKFDAVADKLAIGIVAIGVIENNLVPLPITLGIVAQNGLNTVLSSRGKLNNKETHSSKTGKLATTFQWITMGLFGMSTYLEQKNLKVPDNIIKALGDASLVPTIWLSAKASLGYYKDFK